MVRRRATRRYKRIHKGGGKLIHTLKPGHRNIAWNEILEIGQCYIMYNNVEKERGVRMTYRLTDTTSREFIGNYTGVTTLDIQGNQITFFNFSTSSEGPPTRKMVEFGPNGDRYTADGTIFFSKVDCEGPKAGGRRIKKKRRTRKKRKKKRTRTKKKKRTRTRTKRR